MRVKVLLRALSLVAFPCLMSPAMAVDWLQFGYDAAHSSNNPDETTVTRANGRGIMNRSQLFSRQAELADTTTGMIGAPLRCATIRTAHAGRPRSSRSRRSASETTSLS